MQQHSSEVKKPAKVVTLGRQGVSKSNRQNSHTRQT